MTTSASLICAETRTPLSPISRRTLGDNVLETLRKAIISGAFAPGDHVAEGVLAQQLGVSRAPVREAMMNLEREGLLEFDKRGAALVKIFTDADFEEIFSLRLALETMAARLAASRLTAADGARLEANIAQTQEATTLLAVTLLDVEFHELIVESAGHARLRTCWKNLRHQIEVWLGRLQSRRETPHDTTRDDTARYHQLLLEVIRSGDGRKAEDAMRAHIEGWREHSFPKAR